MGNANTFQKGASLRRGSLPQFTPSALVAKVKIWSRVWPSELGSFAKAGFVNFRNMIFRALLIKGWEARCGTAGGNLDSALPLGHLASQYKVL